MGPEIVTATDAIVDGDREPDLLEGYRQLIKAPKPDGLLRSELLRAQGGRWRIQTTWRDREALLAVRDTGARPASLELLDRIGAEHTHMVFTVEARLDGTT